VPSWSVNPILLDASTRDDLHVASSLVFASQELVHLDHLSFCWVNIKRFALIDSGALDRDVLGDLIADRQYHDDYLGRDSVQREPAVRHGPYWLTAISADTFETIQPDDAVHQIQGWADRDGPMSNRTQAQLETVVYALIRGAIFRLPDLGEQTQHEYGYAVGSDRGFHEYVAIDRDAGTLALIVTADD
jgi:hypothetical protein